jgi:hypothetical protein
VHPPLPELALDLLSSVVDFTGPDNPGRFLLHNGQSSHLASWVDFDPMGMGDRFFHCPVFEYDGKRPVAKDGRPPGPQELPHSRRVARIQRLPVLVQYEHPLHLDYPLQWLLGSPQTQLAGMM